MAKKPVPKLPYDVPWILQRFRALLLGREHNSALRWAKDLAPRTQPQPDLPLGPSSKIRFNYYCDRDPRGEVRHPAVLYDAEMQQKVLGVTGTGPAGCGPLEKEGNDETETSKKVGGENEEGMKEKEEKETSMKAGGSVDKETSKKAEGKVEKETWNKVREKEEKGMGKKEGDKEEKDENKKLREKVENEMSKKAGEKDEKETSKRAGEKEEKETSKKVGDMVGKDASKKPGEKEEKEMSNKKEAGEKDEKEMSKKAGEKEEKETSKETGENEEKEKSNAVKRVPGKVWHWDTIDGEPDKECCRLPRDGY